MPRNKYYKILGLSTNATENDVRKAYRKLVMKYHPDKNQNPGAEDLFIQITEAYEILTGKKDAPVSAERRSQPQTEQNKEEEKKQRVKNAQKRYQEQRFREFLENEIYFRKLTSGVKWKTMKVSAVIGALLALMLIADYILPHHYKEDRVTHYTLNRARGEWGKQLSLVQTESEDKYWISRITYSLYGRYPDIFVESSWIFHNPIRLVSREKMKYRYYDIHFKFYRHSWTLITLFCLPMAPLMKPPSVMAIVATRSKATSL